jgi:Mg-chelatase subunit ChlD
VTLLNPAALWLLLLALPVLALHVLRPRRVAHEVSSTFLWAEISRPVSAARPWQRLRPSVALFLQLLAVVLLALAVAQPARTTPMALARHAVFVIDASGSMTANDAAPSRLDAAKDRAVAVRDELPAGGVASVVVAADEPRVVLTASSDAAAFAAAVQAIEPSAGGADFAGAFTLAASLETPDSPLGVVLVSDGGLTEDQQRVLPAGTRHELIGDQSTNRAISRLTVEPRGSGLHARVSVRNTGGPAATQTVRLDVDGKTATTLDVTLEPGAQQDLEADLPIGDEVEAFLEGEDLLGIDDHAYALTAKRRDVRILVAGPSDPFISELLAVTPGVVVEQSDSPESGAGYDLVIYDGVEVPAEPAAPFIAIAPPGGAPGVEVSGTADQPAIALVRGDDELLEGVDLTAIAIAEAQRVTTATGETLVGAAGAPLLVRGLAGQQPFVYLSFALADSNLPLDIAFPILVDRMITSLAGAGLPPADLVVGQPLPVGTETGITIVEPNGRETALTPGRQAPIATRPGFWTIRTEGRPDRPMAVNAVPAESAIAPNDALPIPVPTSVDGAEPITGEQPVLAWVVLPLLAVLLAEWLVSRRRVGVARRQWRAAVALRIGIALLLVAALLDLTLSRTADRVATVFLIDASDSLGSTRRGEAVDWVQDAMAAQPDGSLSGVALFGGDARLELTVREANRLGQPAVVVDSSRTDLGTALRLAGAVLPTDARRRIVLVSDGRPTQGDVLAEASRLADAGIQVDVHSIGSSSGPDVAVERVDAPSLVHEGEAVALETTIVSGRAATVTVALDRDGEPVEERVVDLVAGSNTVTFDETAAASGLYRYRVRVVGAGDPVPDNDLGYAAVRVEGPATVLLAEGVEGSAETLATALRSGGMVVDVKSASNLPAIDQLSLYSSVVLVDVDIRDLSDEQLGTLAASTRDLGHGLVTIGGTRSYGLGGYRESKLEELLPVISEITDPERRQSVAQVLAIDTSGSMGACHCGSGNNGVMGGNTSGGGVSKTDISRAGASRAIDALSKDDEIGLLSMNNGEQWVIDLQQVPDDEVVSDGLAQLHPSGGTNLSRSLSASAEKLRASKASLKHIILFTDGFTSQQQLATLETEAKALYDGDGITVSVLATGEGAATELEKVAKSGGGRFYPGHDLTNIPQIMQEEVVMASRSFVNEGEWFPDITSAAEPVRDLDSSPALLGYVATTAKPTASTMLQVGDEHDPLLASWQVGLGTATSWTSDASAKWSQRWATWEGYTSFWSGVIKDTLPSDDGSAALSARIGDGTMEVRLESEAPFADGAVASARVTGPDLEGRDVPLERVDATTFVATVGTGEAGTYALGATVTAPDGSEVSASTLASQSYAPEYLPGEPDPSLLARVSATTGGRGEITPAQAFDEDGLLPGQSRVALAALFLVLAALAWPIAVALSRLSFTGRTIRLAGYGAGRAGDWVRDKVPSRPSRSVGGDLAGPVGRPGGAARPRTRERPAKVEDVEVVAARERAAAPPETVSRLLERKRRGGDGGA